MTKKLFFLTTVFFLAAVFTVGVFAEENTENSDIASVNGIVISSDDVKREMNMMYQQAVQQGVYPDSSEIDAYWTKAVDTLVGRELLYQDAVSKGYVPDSAKIDEYIHYLIENSGGEDALKEKLAQQGLDVETLRKDTGVYYVVSDFVSGELRTGISVSDADVQEYYEDNSAMFKQEETVSARHILLTIEEGADQAVVEETKKRISEIRDRILGGEDFSELAKEVSDCPSGEQGGELGEFGRGRMVPPFDEAAFALEPGLVSEPVLTQFGWHLIEVTAKNVGGQIPLSDIKPRLKEYLENLALEEKVNQYVEGIRLKSEIKIFQ